MARPRCAADGCRYAVAPGERWCADPPRGRGHLDLAQRAKALGIKWDGTLDRGWERVTRHGVQRRVPAHPLAGGTGWTYVALIDAHATGTWRCAWCGWTLDALVDADRALVEVRRDRLWCGGCAVPPVARSRPDTTQPLQS